MKIFLIGIKGSGMSALATIYKQKGFEVEGSDVPTSFFTEKNLKKENINIYDFGAKDFEKDIDFVVIGNSFNKEHIDYVNAKNKGLKIIPYYEALNDIVKNTLSIAVSGTNGKTTTTGLLTQTFKHHDPSFLIGDGTGYGNTNSEYFIFEACEYKDTFLNYTPKIALINNVDFDHPDFYENIDHVIKSFQNFASNAQSIVINGDDKNCQKIKHNNKTTFGTNEYNDLIAYNVKYLSEGIKFNLKYKKEDLGSFTLPFYGEHMLYNSLASICVGLVCNEQINVLINNLKQFKGVNRRFNEEIINEKKNAFLIDDYAHHASAIDLTIEAIRQKHPDKKLTVIFQPHTASRTTTFKDEFALSLSNADQIVMAEVFFSAREKNNDVSSKIITDEIKSKYDGSKLINIDQIDTELPNQVICLLGAGDIDLLYKEKIKNLFS